MDTFHIGRFRADNTSSVVANLKSFIGPDGHLGELRKRLDELDCTAEPIGHKVQARERRARKFLMEKLIFYQSGSRVFFSLRLKPFERK